MKQNSWSLIVLFFAVLPFLAVSSLEKAGPDHSQWDRLLQKHVNETGKVDYTGFKEDRALLDAYLAELAGFPVEKSWPRAHKMAYWINAYNAFTIKLIVDQYPINSIRDLHDGNPWDVKWISLGEKTYSLNNIENDILRPQFKDARIHFAVNCAAKSCPPLANKAFTAKNLDELLDQQTQKFINNSRFNQIKPGSVKVSKIFEWYREDFDGLISYLNKYASADIQKSAKIEYVEYDWSLNN
jgi:hypothetical protein